jgi:hypothetical protein
VAKSGKVGGEVDDPFDPANLRLPAQFIPASVPDSEIPSPPVPGSVAGRLRRQRGQGQREQFIMVPQWWTARLEGATGQTWSLAHELLFKSWKTKSASVRVGNKMAGSHASKWRAIVDLERRGLVRIERRGRGKAPLVHLLSSPARQNLSQL